MWEQPGENPIKNNDIYMAVIYTEWFELCMKKPAIRALGVAYFYDHRQEKQALYCF